MSETDLLAGNDKRYYCIDFIFTNLIRQIILQTIFDYTLYA